MSSSDTATGFAFAAFAALPPLAVAFGVAFLAGVFFVSAAVFFAGVAFLAGVFFVSAAAFFAGACFGPRAPFFAAFSAACFSALNRAFSSASSLPQINPPPDSFGGNTLRRLR